MGGHVARRGHQRRPLFVLVGDVLEALDGRRQVLQRVEVGVLAEQPAPERALEVDRVAVGIEMLAHERRSPVDLSLFVEGVEQVGADVRGSAVGLAGVGHRRTRRVEKAVEIDGHRGVETRPVEFARVGLFGRTVKCVRVSERVVDGVPVVELVVRGEPQHPSRGGARDRVRELARRRTRPDGVGQRVDDCLRVLGEQRLDEPFRVLPVLPLASRHEVR